MDLKKSEEAKLKKLLEELRSLHDSLGSKYSLRADLKDLSNRSFTVGKLLQEELDKIKVQREDLNKECEATKVLKLKLESSLNSIEELEQRFQNNEGEISPYERLLEITSDEQIEILEDSKKEILDKYAELFEQNDKNEIIVDKLSNKITQIEEKYSELFEELNTDGENLFEQLESKINRLSIIWEEYFTEDEDGETKSDLIDVRLKKLDQFYTQIYGDKAKELPSLKDDLEDRLINLKEIEKKAKEILDYSSEAGLAGGFVLKRKEANYARWFSLSVFIFAIIFMFLFNYNFFERSDFENLKWSTILFKITINAPIIWIATIANINLNKFSRLEQDYSHKEALAKSYERYRSEINQLKTLGVEGAENLNVKLLETNLDAFKVNPANFTNQNKRDGISIMELIKLKLIGSK